MYVYTVWANNICIVRYMFLYILQTQGCLLPKLREYIYYSSCVVRQNFMNLLLVYILTHFLLSLPLVNMHKQHYSLVLLQTL